MTPGGWRGPGKRGKPVVTRPRTVSSGRTPILEGCKRKPGGETETADGFGRATRKGGTAFVRGPWPVSFPLTDSGHRDPAHLAPRH